LLKKKGDYANIEEEKDERERELERERKREIERRESEIRKLVQEGMQQMLSSYLFLEHLRAKRIITLLSKNYSLVEFAVRT
jgi:tyrosine-protein phosphatase YwqE